MSWVEVDGLVLPAPVAGHPALELVNTRAGWGSPRPREYLLDYAHLAGWAGHVGLLAPHDVRRLRRLGARASQADAAAAAVLVRALRLRDAVRVAALGARGTSPTGAEAAAWRLLRDEARAAVAVADLDPGGWRLGATTGLVAPLAAAALSAVDLLTAVPAVPVGECGGVGCGWVFADPLHRRRWCDMAVCGNRAKARRHAARVRAARPTATGG